MGSMRGAPFLDSGSGANCRFLYDTKYLRSANISNRQQGSASFVRRFPRKHSLDSGNDRIQVFFLFYLYFRVVKISGCNIAKFFNLNFLRIFKV
jgi:hypothetical protein